VTKHILAESWRDLKFFETAYLLAGFAGLFAIWGLKYVADQPFHCYSSADQVRVKFAASASGLCLIFHLYAREIKGLTACATVVPTPFTMPA
jgi:hypothetical protein